MGSISRRLLILVACLVAVGPATAQIEWGDHEVRCLVISDDDGTTETCFCSVTDRIWHDTDCDQTKDAGEEWVDFVVPDCFDDFGSSEWQHMTGDGTVATCVDLLADVGCTKGSIVHVSQDDNGAYTCNALALLQGGTVTLKSSASAQVDAHCDSSDDCFYEMSGGSTTKNLYLTNKGGLVRIVACDGSQGACGGSAIIYLDSEVLASTDVNIGTVTGGVTAAPDLGVEGDLTVLGNVHATLPAFLGEIFSAESDVTSFGQIWVKNSTPNELWFTDDAGIDVRLGGTAPPLTAALTSITHTDPGTPDYAISNMASSALGTVWGFATQDEANTVLSVVASLQTRVNELESKLTDVGILLVGKGIMRGVTLQGVHLEL